MSTLIFPKAMHVSITYYMIVILHEYLCQSLFYLVRISRQHLFLLWNKRFRHSVGMNKMFKSCESWSASCVRGLAFSWLDHVIFLETSQLQTLICTLVTLMTSFATDVINHNGCNIGRFKPRRFWWENMPRATWNFDNYSSQHYFSCTEKVSANV